MDIYINICSQTWIQTLDDLCVVTSANKLYLPVAQCSPKVSHLEMFLLAYR